MPTIHHFIAAPSSAFSCWSPGRYYSTPIMSHSRPFFSRTFMKSCRQTPLWQTPPNGDADKYYRSITEHKLQREFHVMASYRTAMVLLGKWVCSQGGDGSKATLFALCNKKEPLVKALVVQGEGGQPSSASQPRKEQHPRQHVGRYSPARHGSATTVSSTAATSPGPILCLSKTYGIATRHIEPTLLSGKKVPTPCRPRRVQSKRNLPNQTPAFNLECSGLGLSELNLSNRAPSPATTRKRLNQTEPSFECNLESISSVQVHPWFILWQAKLAGLQSPPPAESLS